MATKAYKTTSLTDFTLTPSTKAKIEECAMVIDVDANPPYAAFYIQADSAGSDEAAGDYGALRLRVRYSDATDVTLVTNRAPFASVAIDTDSDWYVLKRDGSFRRFGNSAPTDSTSPNASSSDSVGERFSLSPSKTPLGGALIMDWAGNV